VLSNGTSFDLTAEGGSTLLDMKIRLPFLLDGIPLFIRGRMWYRMVGHPHISCDRSHIT
jgi:hypothetical protein